MGSRTNEYARVVLTFEFSQQSAQKFKKSAKSPFFHVKITHLKFGFETKLQK